MIATTPMVFSSHLRRRLGAAQVQPPRHHRHEPGLDLPVTAELLPAHLDVRAHHQVRLGRVRARRLPAGAPAPQQRHPAEHARLARPGRGAARSPRCRRRVPQVGQDVHAAPLELGGLRVLVLVDHVLGGALGHQQLGLRLHPGGDERRQVEPGVAVQDQLVADHLQRGARQHAALAAAGTAGSRAHLADVNRVDFEFLVLAVLVDLGVQGHGGLHECAGRRVPVARLTRQRLRRARRTAFISHANRLLEASRVAGAPPSARRAWPAPPPRSRRPGWPARG